MTPTEGMPEKIYARFFCNKKVILTGEKVDYDSVEYTHSDLVSQITRERDTYKKAKEENDERFMIERDEARRERDAAREELKEARELMDEIGTAQSCPYCDNVGYSVRQVGGCDMEGENDTREQIQEQCDWCGNTPNSIYLVRRRIAAFLTKKGG